MSDKDELQQFAERLIRFVRDPSIEACDPFLDRRAPECELSKTKDLPADLLP